VSWLPHSRTWEAYVKDSCHDTALSLLDSASIKDDVKAVLCMQRKPRGLSLFWYFLWCYKSPTSTIGNTLRSPDTLIIQKNLRMKEPDYGPWFSKFCVWRFGGAYNYVNGKKRELKRWTAEADLLFQKWQHLTIPFDVERLFYRQTRDVSPSLSTIGNTLARPFYHNTSSSPNRWYHPLQNLTTEQKKAAFSGCVNVDIVSCYTSIWWYEMGGKDCQLPHSMLLHPDHKEELYKLLMRDFNLTGRAAAKTLRQTLTSDYKNGHHYSHGVEWFDDLHRRILEDCYTYATVNELGRPSAHKVFTWLEWCIIERMLEAGDEVLLMHDGIIFKECNIPRLRAAAAPYKLQIERW